MAKTILLYVIVCAVVFGVCFLIDKLLKKCFRKSDLEGGKNVVRQPRRGFICGILLIFFALMVLLFWMPEDGDTLLLIGSVTAILLGILLLVSFFSFAIWYDEEKFVFKDFHHKKAVYYYKDIRGQRSLMTRSGVNSTLLVGEETLDLSSSMQGLNAFLKTAFFGWCRAKGIEPDSIENNPRLFTWFPDPDGEKEEENIVP